MNLHSIYKKILGSGNQKKIIKGVLWTFLGTLISKGFIFIALFLVARILSVDEYGKLGLLQSYINTFSMISLASFGVTATKYLALYAENEKLKASQIYSLTRSSVFIIALVILILSIIFNNSIGNYIVGNQSMSNEVLLCAFAIFFSSLNGLQTGALAGLENFKSISIVNMVNGLLSLPLILFSAYRYGVFGVVVSLVLINFSIWLCSAILLQKELNRKNITFTTKGLKGHLETVYNFTLPSFISSMMLSPVVLICNSLLIKYSSKGYYELGIYNASFNFSQVATLLLGVIGQVTYPMAIKNFGKENKKFEFFNINQSYIIVVIIFLPIIILPDIFSGLYGNKYQNNEMYISLMFVSLSTIIIGQRQGIARNFAAGNLMWFSVFSNFIWAVTSIAFCYLLLDYGAKGRAIGFFIGYLINSIIFIPYYLNKKLIHRDLLISKTNLAILLIVVSSYLSFIYIENYFIRIGIMIVMLLFSLLSFYKWFKNYTDVRKNNIQIE
ncbi:oligosaccharide flippase family protein [Empedobacter brevis]|uniref:Oligosaccharide flippase family protein n=1 Tax=Empedobacter brevis TaxID=247 RepID=A0AAJ1VA04_9FLAO|nr:oligosaccharide flippase family protein [Empedobacter brevis]MDM1073325.1 oligosaccharide flippase family protein [Empedobacter brevis]